MVGVAVMVGASGQGTPTADAMASARRLRLRLRSSSPQTSRDLGGSRNVPPAGSFDRLRGAAVERSGPTSRPDLASAARCRPKGRASQWCPWPVAATNASLTPDGDSPEDHNLLPEPLAAGSLLRAASPVAERQGVRIFGAELGYQALCRPNNQIAATISSSRSSG